ncbi:acyl-CoA dehydrogenase family protein [Alloalcanivorax marinus]|uniref:acyl-CoA dehydrogenase family protein n=1 Tax=Alloalcanivorax marinus TaxID=1177169 RepID=UPI001931E413|nr:acyl-CoA dehydrogenase family protein [Alloalcanivorax marinus]MBL7249919.1 acyl-CoA dehydrogenase family protein [Alloalcanivorax marinus]
MSIPAPAWMNEDLRIFQDSVRRMFENEFVPREARWLAQGYPDREVWRELGRLGLLCAGIPEQYGGGGGGFGHEAVICQEQFRAQLNSFSLNVHSNIVAHYLLNYGSEEQRRHWLPGMASGETVAAIAMSEPGAGSDLQAVRTTAQRDGDDYLINGAKTFITNGYHADLVCVVAKTDGQAKGSRGISLILVDAREVDGFRRGRLLKKIGQRGQDTAELFFDQVRVPRRQLLGGEEGRGFTQLMEQLPRERLLIAIGAAAAMRRAIDDTLEYVNQRQVFGQRLLDMQNTRFKLAEAHTQATVVDCFINDCIQRVMDGGLDVPTAAMAKWWTTQLHCQVVDECLQLHGGYGYMEEYPISRMYTDARVGKVYGGANEIMKEVIARDLDRRFV